MDSHHFKLSDEKPQNASEYGFRIKATKSNFPALRNMSLYKLVLKPEAAREPHWHANADELGYCTEGEVIVSFYGNGNAKESFLVSKGEAFFIPSGALHGIENAGEGSAELVLQFSSEEPEDFALSSSLNMFSNAVLGNTWSLPASHFSPLPRPIPEAFVGKMDKAAIPSKSDRYASIYRYRLEASSPVIVNEEGSAKLARENIWPVLQRQALYSLHLTGEGMREPHWHPETAELGYVNKGKGRMSILSPSGNIDTYVMEQGDIYFIPKAYPHHIENLNSTELHLLIFFDRSMPQDIGFTGSVKSFSDEALSAAVPNSKEVFEKLPVYYEDLFIVKKKNPLD